MVLGAVCVGVSDVGDYHGCGAFVVCCYVHEDVVFALCVCVRVCVVLSMLWLCCS